MTYFDYSSTTKVNPEVLETYKRLLDNYYVNSESLYPSGVEINSLMEKAREQIAKLCGVNSEEIIFTSGGSESNSLAIKGTALKRQSIGKHIVTSYGEHSSVINSCRWLQDYLGYEVTYLPLNKDGVIDLAKLQAAMRDDTILVTIMYVNNETGAISPIEGIKEIVRKYPNCYLHVDCVQAFGKMKIDLQGIDMASVSAHKIFGLKGSGFLIKKQSVELAELISGGQQEYHLRGGTANHCTNIALAKAVRLALQDLDGQLQKVTKQHAYFIDKLAKINHIVINSPANSSPYVVNFSCLTITSQVMLNALAAKGYEVSAQSTCDSKDAISRVLAQMYSDTNRLKGTIRVSLSKYTLDSEIDGLLQAIKEIVEQYG